MFVGFVIQTKLFGGELSCLISSDQSVPPLVDKLIQDIEKRGKVIWWDCCSKWSNEDTKEAPVLFAISCLKSQGRASIFCSERAQRRMVISSRQNQYGTSKATVIVNMTMISYWMDLILFFDAAGFYTEGLYRKSPSNVAVKKLKNEICTFG